MDLAQLVELRKVVRELRNGARMVEADEVEGGDQTGAALGVRGRRAEPGTGPGTPALQDPTLRGRLGRDRQRRRLDFATVANQQFPSRDMFQHQVRFFLFQSREYLLVFE